MNINTHQSNFESLVPNLKNVEEFYNRFKNYIIFQEKFLNRPNLWYVKNENWIREKEFSNFSIQIANIDRIYYVSHQLTQMYEYFITLIRMKYKTQSLYIEFWVTKDNNNNNDDDDMDSFKKTVIEADINIFRNSYVFMNMVNNKLNDDDKKLIYKSLYREGDNKNYNKILSYLCHTSIYKRKNKLKLFIPKVIPKVIPFASNLNYKKEERRG